MIEVYNKDGIRHRRDIPEDSGALACIGFSWAELIELLSNTIKEAAPEVCHKQTAWIVRARPNGIRIEFFADDDALARRIEQHSVDGPQIHAGRLSWL